MTRTLQKIGNSRGLVLTRTMLDHLGVTDAIEVEMQDGRIVLTAPPAGIRPPRRQTFGEAKAATYEQYDNALRRLSEPGEGG